MQLKSLTTALAITASVGITQASNKGINSQDVGYISILANQTNLSENTDDSILNGRIQYLDSNEPPTGTQGMQLTDFLNALNVTRHQLLTETRDMQELTKFLKKIDITRDDLLKEKNMENFKLLLKAVHDARDDLLTFRDEEIPKLINQLLEKEDQRIKFLQDMLLEEKDEEMIKDIENLISEGLPYKNNILQTIHEEIAITNNLIRSIDILIAEILYIRGGK